MKKITIFLVTITISLALAGNLLAAWGDVDLSFGTGGVLQESTRGYQPIGAAVQSDGKILVTGRKFYTSGQTSLFLLRYLSNGARDTTFDSNGLVTLPDQPGSLGHFVLPLPDGKIVVAGSGGAGIGCAIWRFTSNGALDNSFGTNGRVVQSASGTSFCVNVAAQNDKLITAALVWGSDDVLTRLNSDGSTDTTFGTGGSVTLGIRYVRDLIVDPAGKIVVAGNEYEWPEPKKRPTWDRLTASGSNDFFFLPGSMSPCLYQSGTVRMSSGKFFTLCSGEPGTGNYLFRYGSGGSQEAMTTLPPPNGGTLLQQSDGRVVVIAGDVYRFDANFFLNATFNDSPTYDMTLVRLYAMQPDNKLLFIGLREATGLSDGKLTIMRALAG